MVERENRKVTCCFSVQVGIDCQRQEGTLWEMVIHSILTGNVHYKGTCICQNLCTGMIKVCAFHEHKFFI